MSAKTHTARLVYGQSYTLGQIRFEKGVEVAIDDATKAKLEERAVDTVTISSGDEDVEVEVRQKFSFAPIGGEARARTRGPAPAGGATAVTGSTGGEGASSA